ncbi:hypothetical protein EHV15_27715 [Paenibacillus oralis]|uniref:Uncharacterized protein n=1 Tax=Paenibacillus oralis TaxID=2490856 RepID=A0A3P3U7R1_9BACL|nr:hypothetical protein [Paenibacillus oralis]RRJ66280.1 hypothetical protein EHV15_27715 [Paenibacillus oralis]
MSAEKEMDRRLWIDYIHGNVEGGTAERMEALLLGDEAAFAAYAEALSTLEPVLPKPEDEDAFMQGVLAALPETELRRNEDRHRKRWSGHPLVHYVIAASVTVLLLSGGFFDRLAAGANYMMDLNRSQDASISRQMMDAASGWLDKWKR